jgi:probable phosphoglycerate mutase
MSETRLILIRHGEAQAAVEGFVAGHDGCCGLSDVGRSQAEALRDRLLASNEIAAHAVHTSVLPRAIETAEILAPALGGLKAQQDCDWCELHPGECDGLTWEEYRARYAFDMRSEPERPMSPGGESLKSFQVRVEARLEGLVREHAGQTVVIVCHGGVIQAVSLSMMSHGLHTKRPFRMEPENTSMTEWVLHAPDALRPGWVLVRFNDAAHL